jgi:shikimate dehydrogenase
MHNAAFAALGMDWRYVPLPVAPHRVGEAVLGLRGLGFRGANVTVPHKQAVIPYLDRLTPAAEAIGAVNTICVTADDALLGDNTDAAGFIADLRANGVEPEQRRALVLGAGGSARAIVYGLAEVGCKSIAIVNRSVDRAERLAEDMSHRFPDCQFTVHPFPEGVESASIGADLIVNCTTLGMTPLVEGLPWDEDVEFYPEQTVYDLVYSPSATRLLQIAAADGAVAIGGIGMLIHQGAIAFERWTGERPPVAVMRSAVNVMFDA